MRQHFEISRDSEYFSERELHKRMGTNSRNSWVPALFKELVDNSLDATDGRDSEIDIKVSEELLSVWDNGPGMSPDLIEKILDFSSRTSDKTAYQGPTRGQQGNALKTLLGVAYNLDGYVEIISRNRKHTISCEINPGGSVDTNHEIEDHSCTGTEIILYADDIDPNLLRWAMNYHLCNPYVKIRYFSTYGDDDNARFIEDVKPRVFYKSGSLNKIKTTDPTSIHWYSFQKFQELAYLQADKENIPLGDFVASFHGLSSSAKRKRISAGLPSLKEVAADSDRCHELLSRMKNEAKEIKPKALGLIGKETMVSLLKADRHWYKSTTGVYDGKPWAFEVLVNDGGHGVVLSAVNHSITFRDFMPGDSFFDLNDGWLQCCDFGAAIYKYGGPDSFMFVHFISISPEFTGYGKDKITLPREIRKEMARCTRLTLATLRKETKKKKQEKKKEEKKRTPPKEEKATIKDMMFEILPAAIARSTANGTIYTNTRNIYYKARPVWLAKGFGEVSYNYFAELLKEYWRNIGGRDYRVLSDARGAMLFEPHTDVELRLGTKQVREYSIPDYQYNKILYIEKAGFDEILEETRLGKKYDMAIISTKGYASEAVKDLLQAASDKEITIFILHDCDVGGYEIYRTIVEATKNMPDHKITAVDLGLKVQDCIDMELPVETFTRFPALPAKMDLTEVEREWFQGKPGNVWSKGAKKWKRGWVDCKRVELNELDKELPDYIDEKLNDYFDGLEKVIPPDDIQRKRAEKTFDKFLDIRVASFFRKRVLDLTKRIKAEFILPKNRKLEVEEYLDDNNYDKWEEGVDSCVSTFMGDLDLEINDFLKNETIPDFPGSGIF